jgi:hypothetical protein
MPTSLILKGNTQWWAQLGEAFHHPQAAFGECPKSGYESLMLMAEFGGDQKVMPAQASNDT